MRVVEKRLRERIKALEQELIEVKVDRDKFREHFAGRFRGWVALLGKQEEPSLKWLIENDAKFLAGVKWWPW